MRRMEKDNASCQVNSVEKGSEMDNGEVQEPPLKKLRNRGMMIACA